MDEDCTVMWELYNQHQNWDETFKAYQKTRKADGDALQDLSLHNYYVMRDHVANDDFLLQKKIEAKLHEKHPEKWIPLYSQVTFSHIPYSKAIAQGKKQDLIMKEILKDPSIHEIWDSEEIEHKILSKL